MFNHPDFRSNVPSVAFLFFDPRLDSCPSWSSQTGGVAALLIGSSLPCATLGPCAVSLSVGFDSAADPCPAEALVACGYGTVLEGDRVLRLHRWSRSQITCAFVCEISSEISVNSKQLPAVVPDQHSIHPLHTRALKQTSHLWGHL